MADVASQHHILDRTIFLTNFSAMFPHPQGEFWTMFLLSDKITSKVSSELLKRQLTLESWRRLPTKEYVFGKLGPISSPSTFQTMTKNSVHCHNQKNRCAGLFRPTCAFRRRFSMQTTSLCANSPSIAAGHHSALRTGRRTESGG
jgi:hypothetical protein